MNKQFPSLLLCILLDVIGYASFTVPVLAEFSDIIWAPVSGFIFYKLFGGWRFFRADHTHSLLPLHRGSHLRAQYSRLMTG